PPIGWGHERGRPVGGQEPVGRRPPRRRDYPSLVPPREGDYETARGPDADHLPGLSERPPPARGASQPDQGLASRRWRQQCYRYPLGLRDESAARHLPWVGSPRSRRRLLAGRHDARVSRAVRCHALGRGYGAVTAQAARDELAE